MGRYALFSMLMLVTVAVTKLYAAEPMTADQQAIAKIEHEWNEATKAKDGAFFKKHLSDDFTYINEDGDFISGPAAYIDVIMKMPKVVEYTSTDEQIRVHGSTAVATGRFTFKSSDGSATTRFTDTYAKGLDGWKAVASQETNAK